MVPCGDTTFVPHNCFTTREANAFYTLDLVQPVNVVHPYELWGPLKDCPWYNFWSAFPTRQWSEFEDYIKIYAINGERYDPYDTDKRLPTQHRQFTVCAECGRQAQECWAMGSMVNFNSPFDQSSYVACVYCSTYRALVAFLDTDMKWFDALQLRGLDDERERALKGLNTTLAWLQEAIVIQVCLQTHVLIASRFRERSCYGICQHCTTQASSFLTVVSILTLSRKAEVACSAKVQESSLPPPATKNEAPVVQSY
ncbi:hypothetical protein ABBQ32_012198 [Trebouxia sp. C0010 RCD-2024]